MRLSYSQLEWFLRCPYVYKALFIDKQKIPRGKDAVFGGLLHRVFENVYKDRPMILTLSEALALFEKEWDRREAASYFASPLDAQVHFKEGMQIIKNYYEKNNLEDARILALEQFFEVPIEDKKTGQTHLLTGRIDRIDQLPGGLEIIDYKTNKTLKSEADIADDLQLSLYHLGVSNLWPQMVKQYNEEVYVSLYFLRHTQKVSVKKTKQQLQKTQEQLLEYIRQMEEAITKDTFEPKASILCGREPYCRICPFFSDRYRTNKPPIKEDIQVNEVIGEYITLKEQEKTLKERLGVLNSLINGYLDDQKLEAIYDGSLGITRSSLPSYEFDAVMVRSILEPLGKWEDVLDLSKTKLNKIKKELPREHRTLLEQAQTLKRVAKVLRTKKIV